MPIAHQSPTRIQWWPHPPPALPGSRWCIAHVKPRQDKQFGQTIGASGGLSCCLLSASVRHYPGKGTQTSWLPLLPGYVFVNLAADEMTDTSLYATGRCVRILRISQQDHFVAEFSNLLTLAEQAPTPLVVQPHLVPGTEIVIRQGTFAGCQGLVQRRQGVTELVVNLQVLGCSVATTLPAEWADLFHQ